MTWLNVPHLRQSKSGWCLPACAAMVTAYLQDPLLQDDVARWLGTDDLIGTPANRILRLIQRGYTITYHSLASLSELEHWLVRKIPPILFVLTGELSYWTTNTQHAVVLAGFTDANAYLFDPDIDTAPIAVSVDELMLAWSHLDYTYATIELTSA